jgi:two-component sensor histidine kinase
MTAAPLRLLYIDDDPALARLVQKGLQRRGYVVQPVPDGDAGLAKLREGGIDVVALDHYMPGQDGLATLAAIRAMPDPPPVIYVTGTQESSVAVAALKAGACDYVAKTAEGEFVDLLARSIDQCVAAVQMRRAKEAAEAEVRAARDRFEALAAERALLMREVNHRVGNSLQIIAALLHLQSAASQNEDVKSALAGANRRVMAVAQVHRRLYTSDDVQSVALDQYLEALAGDLRRSTDSLEKDAVDMLSLEAEPVIVEPDRAVAVGVIVTELVINAQKYAYPNGRGPIRVGLRKQGTQRACVSVEDDGIGGAGPVGAPSKGLGQLIVNTMAKKLDAEWSYDEEHQGTRVTLCFDSGIAVSS